MESCSYDVCHGGTDESLAQFHLDRRMVSRRLLCTIQQFSLCNKPPPVSSPVSSEPPEPDHSKRISGSLSPTFSNTHQQIDLAHNLPFPSDCQISGHDDNRPAPPETRSMDDGDGLPLLSFVSESSQLHAHAPVSPEIPETPLMIRCSSSDEDGESELEDAPTYLTSVSDADGQSEKADDCKVAYDMEQNGLVYLNGDAKEMKTESETMKNEQPQKLDRDINPKLYRKEATDEQWLMQKEIEMESPKNDLIREEPVLVNKEDDNDDDEDSYEIYIKQRLVKIA
ncbi:unnamed protein product [Protopolystoma xenopodis]|uniref:Uncharacterized protein n=1 Tax=Protopolystoma xenopodis TaxID=117903 RepID=A0A448WH11_9PLAT|nr:unnamed protein product [Protopolystoma xenopodis]